MTEKNGQASIARAEVKKLAENLSGSAEEVLKLVAEEDIQVDRLLEVTRYMARSARRIERKRKPPAPEPGNERDRGGEPRAGGAGPKSEFGGRRTRKPTDGGSSRRGVHR